MKNHSKLIQTPDDPEQSKRFIETAKDMEVDQSQEALENAFKKLAPSKPEVPRS